MLAARDGPGALRMIERNAEIALLFTDVVLPGMNGRELARAALRRRPDLRVLYATGYSRNAVFHQERWEPEGQLLTKPFTYETLARKIRQMRDSTAGSARPAEI